MVAQRSRPAYTPELGGKAGLRFSRCAASPSATSGPVKPNISSASDVSKAGPACRSQLLSEYLVQRIALCAPSASRVAISTALRVELGIFDGEADKPDPLGLGAEELVAQQEIIFGLGHAAQERPDDRGVIAGSDAEPGVAVDDAALLAGDRDIGEEPADEPGADRHAAHGADDRLSSS